MKNSFSCTFQFLGAAMVIGVQIPPLFKLGTASLAFLTSITLTLLHPFPSFKVASGCIGSIHIIQNTLHILRFLNTSLNSI